MFVRVRVSERRETTKNREERERKRERENQGETRKAYMRVDHESYIHTLFSSLSPSLSSSRQ